MAFCKQLNKDFSSKDEMFKALKENESKIIQLKKDNIFKSIEKGQVNIKSILDHKSEALKGLDFVDEGYIYPVINTTNYMDSHDDVHFPNIWKKSIQEQQGKTYYITDHTLGIDNVIAWPNSVEMFTKELNWSDLGQSFTGKTQALIFKIAKANIKIDGVLKAIEEKQPLQNSIRMRYINIKLAIDSKDEAYKENKAYFDSRINEIANKDQVIEQGYFYGVEEAQIYKEGSLVLFGSNDITPILIAEPEKSTQDKNEPSVDTQEKRKFIINILNS